jgi:hypothetical protein
LLTTIGLLSALQTKGVRLGVRGDQLAVDAPKGVLTGDLRAAIRQHKAALLAMLAQDGPPVPLSASPSVDLNMPLEALQEPAHIWSDILHTDFYVCATPAQAAPLLAVGKTVYLPAEIRVLHQLKDRGPATFPEKLRAIHQSKALFGALVMDAALPADTAEKAHDK